MVQLVQLKKFEKQFADLETEVIVVFREDRKQVEGLKITKKKTQAPFTVLGGVDKSKMLEK